MTTTADAPQDVTAGTADEPDPSGLTAEEIVTLTKNQAVTWGIFSAAAARSLQGERPAAEEAVTQAEGRLSEAVSAAQGPCDAVARLESELATCEARAAELAAAADSDELGVRLDARNWRLAIEQESEALRERLQLANRAADPCRNTLLQAEHDAQLARRDLASLDDAIAAPLFHPLGMATRQYEDYLQVTGLWRAENKHSKAARRIVDGWLRSTGIKAEIESAAIAEFKAGLRPHEGGTKTWPDGASLVNPGNGGVPVQVNGRATAADLQGVPPVPTTAPTGEQVMGGMRTGAPQGPPAAPTVTKSATIDADWPLPAAIRRVWR